jgi:hypothetical protein
MERQPLALPLESRWPALFAILIVLVLLAVLPERIRIFPSWVIYALGIIVLAPIAAVCIIARSKASFDAERAGILIFVLAGGFGALVGLANLIEAMISRPAHASGLQLLTSSIAVWVTNVLVFSLLFWQMDRGGPQARMIEAQSPPDWFWQQDSVVPGEPKSAWRPVFIDYLYLSYCTATSFSAGDAVPLTSRAKLLVMLESTISLVSIVVVASRAINILG